MTGQPFVGGFPLLELRSADSAPLPRLTRALIAPGRAMMLVQLWAEMEGLGEVELIAAPAIGDAVRKLNDHSIPFPGNTAFAFGGAILAPFANRIRGREDGKSVMADIAGAPARLPANGGAKRPWAERYAIHGLILDRPVRSLDSHKDHAIGRIALGESGTWPSVFDLVIEWRLSSQALSLSVKARNTGEQAAPIGLGWHPYFNLLSGDRSQAGLEVPSKLRAEVDDYDSVLPTGRITDVTNSPYDFSMTGGRVLGGLYLDDCFVDPWRDAQGEVAIGIFDPKAKLALRVASAAPAVSAIQVYAPPDKAFVVVEPQFNLADPYGAEWSGRDTGMVELKPDGEVSYDARVEIHLL